MNPSGEFQGVALVTGSGRGLGAAMAEELARLGFDLAVHYRSSEKGALATCRKVHALGRRAEPFCADLSNEKAALGLLSEIGDAFGRLDVLINNSGVYHARPHSELAEKEWFEGINSTASACFFTTRAALPLLRRSKRGGRVINIGDSSCERPTARSMAMGYHIGKTGVLMLTRSFAQQEARHGLTVNMLSPGYLENSLDLPEAEAIPAARFGTFADMTTALRFLISPESTYLNGSNLILSGGWNLR